MLTAEQIDELESELNGIMLDLHKRDEVFAGIYGQLYRSTIGNLRYLWFYNEALKERNENARRSTS